MKGMVKMNKILVKLYVPTIGEQYDVWIPVNRKIYSVIKLIVKVVNEFTNGENNPSKLPVLYNKKTGKIYDINFTVSDSEIENGSEIMLI